MTDRLRIVLLASEVVPFVKTGGLADVAGALARALAARGHEVHVVLPLYGQLDRVNRERHGITTDGSRVDAWFPDRPESLEVHTTDHRPGEPRVWFLSHPLFDRDGLYGDRHGEFGDNHLRFALLCRGALELCRRRFPSPDILHLHDWQTGLAAVDLRCDECGIPRAGFERTRIVFTIHNLAYMGRFEHHQLRGLGYGDALFTPDTLEFYGVGVLIKGGLVFSDWLTTVSPRYAREIQTPEFGYGLEGLLHARSGQLMGILNGIDTHDWNPATDRHLPANYDVDDLSGKAICKSALQEEMGLVQDAERPLFGVVARLAWQKGIDLVADVADRLVYAGAQLAILGTGEPALEARLSELAGRHPGRVAVRLGFDEGLAHRIEAGSDAFLMPSRYEPCGLNQMYSLRYGTVPVVRAVGGLDDTVDERDSHTGNGFKFGAATVDAFQAALTRALDAWKQPVIWRGLQRRGMQADFSWNASAAAYEQLFLNLCERGLERARGAGDLPASPV